VIPDQSKTGGESVIVDAWAFTPQVDIVVGHGSRQQQVGDGIRHIQAGDPFYRIGGK